jgi:uncharacterized protein (DUF1697 family)
MTVWIGLLRAVTVGGHNILPMAELRAALTTAGLAGVKTYVQSGNLVFRSDRPRHELGPLIADTIHAKFGFRPPVLVLSREEMERARDGHPFAQAVAEPTTLHVFFMERPLPEATGAFLRSLAVPGEDYAFRGKLLWLYLPHGAGRSKLAQRVTALPLDVTARNLRTVMALVDLTAKV